MILILLLLLVYLIDKLLRGDGCGEATARAECRLELLLLCDSLL